MHEAYLATTYLRLGEAGDGHSWTGDQLKLSAAHARDGKGQTRGSIVHIGSREVSCGKHHAAAFGDRQAVVSQHWSIVLRCAGHILHPGDCWRHAVIDTGSNGEVAVVVQGWSK